MLKSQLEIINQGLSYLESVSQVDYTAVISPNFMSSAGAHMRHIIDHYQSIASGIEVGIINYDLRDRGGEIESSPQLAKDKLNKIIRWINNLTADNLAKLVTLETEVSVSNINIQTLQTSIARELVYAGSHAVHHYAMITQISLAQKKSLPHSFGLAPATATFMRKESQRGNKSKPVFQ